MLRGSFRDAQVLYQARSTLRKALERGGSQKAAYVQNKIVSNVQFHPFPESPPHHSHFASSSMSSVGEGSQREDPLGGLGYCLRTLFGVEEREKESKRERHLLNEKEIKATIERTLRMWKARNNHELVRDVGKLFQWGYLLCRGNVVKVSVLLCLNVSRLPHFFLPSIC